MWGKCKRKRLTQVKQYKYLGTRIENTGQCKTEVANRINQAKIAFWKKATILRSNISMKTRIRIVMCYGFSVHGIIWVWNLDLFKCNRPQNQCLWNVVLQKNVENYLDFSYHKYCWCITENWFKGNNDVEQPEKQKVVLCGTHNEKHIRTVWYHVDNNRRKTGRQTGKRETQTNMGRRSKRLE